MAGSAVLRDPAPFARADETAPFHPSQADALGTSKQVLRLKLYCLQIAADVAAISLSFAFFGLLVGNAPLHGQAASVSAILATTYLMLAFSLRACSVAVLVDPGLGLCKALQSLAGATAIAWSAVLFIPIPAPITGAPTLPMFVPGGAALGLGLVTVERLLLGSFMGKRCGGVFTNDVLLVDRVTAHPVHGEILLRAEEAGLYPSDDNPALLDRIGQLLQHCDRLVLACPTEHRQAWCATLLGLGIDVEILVHEVQRSAGAAGSAPARVTLVVSRGPLGLRARITKRGFDLAVAAPLLVLLLPLLLLIGAAIRLESPGPALFRQRRIGLGNRLFSMVKFRTMQSSMADPDGRRHTRGDDDRVTRVGALLRRTSLDELPQLFNVLAGAMSIAGPRPHPLGALAGGLLFWEVDAGYWRRHAVKPGMTGLAQVRGLRGSTFRPADLSERLQADLEYLDGWTIWRDIGILASTVRVMIHRNAF